MKKSIIPIILLCIITTARAASFNCNKAVESLDQLICNDLDLSKIDQALAKSYHNARIKVIDKISFQEAQHQWLYMRLDCALDKTCLLSAYQKRITELDQNLPLTPPVIPKKLMPQSWKVLSTVAEAYGYMTPLIVFNQNTDSLYIVYNNVGEATVKTFVNKKWITVGESDFSQVENTLIKASLVINPKSNVLYAIYDYNYDASGMGGRTDPPSDYYGSGVRQFNGNKWDLVKNLNHASGGIITFDSKTGSSYIAYNQEDTKNPLIKTIKFNGTNWLPIGNTKITGHSPQIIFNQSNNQLYMLYQYGDYSTQVATLNNNKWIPVGQPILHAFNLSMAINQKNNELYIAYTNPSKLVNASVMKLNGNIWESVGQIEFASKAKPGMMAINNLKVYFNPADQKLYISYSYDESLGSDIKHMTTLLKAAVMSFDGNKWSYVGNPVYTGIASDLSLAFSNGGQAYITYVDNNNQIVVAILD